MDNFEWKHLLRNCVSGLAFKVCGVGPMQDLDALTGFGSSQVFVHRPGGVHRAYESIPYPETSKSDYPWSPLGYLLEEYCGSDFVFVSFQLFFLY